MSRLNVLVSAYACLPGRGSEPGIGWQTARHLSQRHDVWVVTRGDNREAIQEELDQRPNPHLHVVYYDPAGWRRDHRGIQLHYWAWQIGVYRLARALHEQVGFDVAHHVSYVRWWTPSLLALLPVPFIWGPVGGVECVVPSFRDGLSDEARREEFLRAALIRASLHNPLVRMTARRSAVVLANNDQTAEHVRRMGARHVRLMSESSVDDLAFAPVATNGMQRPAPTLFATLTRLMYWKGVHLGLEAFARLDEPDARYWIVGSGPEQERLQQQAEDLGVADRVSFKGDLSRAEWLQILHTCDALVHPCLSNSGNMVSLEAMAAGRPVICLDVGAIRDQVTPDTGFRVPAPDPETTLQGLVQAMRRVVRDRDYARMLGTQAQQRARARFTWSHRSGIFDAVYADVLGRGVLREDILPVAGTEAAAPVQV